MAVVKDLMRVHYKNNTVDEKFGFCDITHFKIITGIMIHNIVSGYIKDFRGIDKFLGTVYIGLPKSSFGFFHNILWKNPNEPSGQPNNF